MHYHSLGEEAVDDVLRLGGYFCPGGERKNLVILHAFQGRTGEIDIPPGELVTASLGQRPDCGDVRVRQVPEGDGNAEVLHEPVHDRGHFCLAAQVRENEVPQR